MDKSKWEYKKLGEVCIVVSGSTPKTQVEEYWNGNHYWITPAELDGSTYVSKSERLITDAAIEKTNLTLLPVGTVLLSSRAPIGKVAITTVPMYCNQGFKNLICSEAIYNKYLYWFLKVNTEYLNSLGRGATFKEISKTIVENIKIPVYSIADQQRIVAELDCLNEMIALKQEQLKEFDKLAQSVFYDMFGDPSINDKGWNMKTFAEIAFAKTGITYKPDNVKDSGIIVLRSSNVQGDELAFDDIVRVDLPISEKYHVQNGDILMCSRNGSARLVGKTAKIINVNEIMTWGAFMTIIRSKYNDYLLQYFKTDAFRNSLSSSKTTTVHQITIGMLNALNIPLPPLVLQQQFAEKIQAIEAQKELVKQSIAETQQLLDSRMDYYFD